MRFLNRIKSNLHFEIYIKINTFLRIYNYGYSSFQLMITIISTIFIDFRLIC